MLSNLIFHHYLALCTIYKISQKYSHFTFSLLLDLIYHYIRPIYSIWKPYGCFTHGFLHFVRTNWLFANTWYWGVGVYYSTNKSFCNYYNCSWYFKFILSLIELRHDKTNKVTVRPAKTQISLGIHPVWSESLLSAWRKLRSLATHSHSKDSDQTGRMPRLIWVYAGRTLILLVLSCHGSVVQVHVP